MRGKEVFFWFGMLIAILVGLCIVPGIDILVWCVLHPVDFWEKLILIVVELVSLWPRVLLAFLLWLGISKLVVEVS